MAGQQKNVFWLGANILVDTRNGDTKPVLMLVYREEDASAFTLEDALSYKFFFASHAEQLSQISWTIQKSSRRPGFFVIRGEQYV